MSPAEEMRDAVLALREGGETPTRELVEPLAALLAEAAALLDEYPDLGRQHIVSEPCDDLACGLVTRARAVARVINGGERA